MNDIKLLTIQHKDVLKQLQEGKTFYADMKRVPENRIAPYLDLMVAYGYIDCPVFAGVVGRKSEFYGAKTEDSVILELIVPEEEVKLQNYYDWSDIIYYIECPSEWNGNISIGEFEEKVFLQTKFNKDEVIQATINRIEPVWLAGYSNFVSEKFISEHLGTGGRNTLKDIEKY